MKRSASPSDLINRSTPWLAWWQELILNWAASWNNVGCLSVSAPDDPSQWVAWSLPNDLELKRLELEELLAANDP